MSKINQLLFLFLFITLFGCAKNVSIRDCDCKSIGIYGYPSTILTPITITREMMLEPELGSPYLVKEVELIEALKLELISLEMTSGGYGVDNRFVLELDCKNGKDIIVESNTYLTQIGESYYTPSEGLILLVKDILKEN